MMMAQTIIDELTLSAPTFTELETIAQSLQMSQFELTNCLARIYPQFTGCMRMMIPSRSMNAEDGVWTLTFEYRYSMSFNRKRMLVNKLRAELHEELMQNVFHPKRLQKFLESDSESDDEIDPTSYLN